MQFKHVSQCASSRSGQHILWLNIHVLFKMYLWLHRHKQH
jgi:hypothetical protein